MQGRFYWDNLHQQNEKTKPSKRPVVAFHNIEAEVYETMKPQANEDPNKDPSKDEDNCQDKNQGCLTDKDVEFELNDDIDPTSPFLCSMVSGEQPLPSFDGLAPPAVTTHVGTGSREATGEEWDNVWRMVCYGGWS